MSLLCVAVKRGRLNGPADRFNTYVTLKLENVKSTTTAVKGVQPCWQQEFLFETNRLDTGLVIELWNKGMLWDKIIGTCWLPLLSIPHSNVEGTGKWVFLDAQISVDSSGEVVGTHIPTGHSLNIDSRFELPSDLQENEALELQKKLAVLNSIMDQELEVLEKQHRRTTPYMPNGVSEDSDYTSDVNYPITHHHNVGAHQYMPSIRRGSRPPMQKQRSTLVPHYPPVDRLQTSYEESQENSFDRPYVREPDYEEHDIDPRRDRSYPTASVPGSRRGSNTSEPLFYNSRPSDRSRLHAGYPQSRSQSPSPDPSFQYQNSTEGSDSVSVRGFVEDRHNRGSTDYDSVVTQIQSFYTENFGSELEGAVPVDHYDDDGDLTPRFDDHEDHLGELDDHLQDSYSVGRSDRSLTSSVDKESVNRQNMVNRLDTFESNYSAGEESTNDWLGREQTVSATPSMEKPPLRRQSVNLFEDAFPPDNNTTLQNSMDSSRPETATPDMLIEEPMEKPSPVTVEKVSPPALVSPPVLLNDIAPAPVDAVVKIALPTAQLTSNRPVDKLAIKHRWLSAYNKVSVQINSGQIINLRDILTSTLVKVTFAKARVVLGIHKLEKRVVFERKQHGFAKLHMKF